MEENGIAEEGMAYNMLRSFVLNHYTALDHWHSATSWLEGAFLLLMAQVYIIEMTNVLIGCICIL